MSDSEDNIAWGGAAPAILSQMGNNAAMAASQTATSALVGKMGTPAAVPGTVNAPPPAQPVANSPNRMTGEQQAQVDIAKSGIAAASQANTPIAAAAVGLTTVATEATVPMSQAEAKVVEYAGTKATDLGYETGTKVVDTSIKGVTAATQGEQGARNLSASLVQFLPPVIAGKAVSEIAGSIRGSNADAARALSKQIYDNQRQCQKDVAAMDSQIANLRKQYFKTYNDYDREQINQDLGVAISMRNQQVQQCNENMKSDVQQLEQLRQASVAEAQAAGKSRSVAQGGDEHNGWCHKCMAGGCDDCGGPNCKFRSVEGGCGCGDVSGGCGCGDVTGGCGCGVTAGDPVVTDHPRMNMGFGDVLGGCACAVMGGVGDGDDSTDITRDIVEGGNNPGKLRWMICLDYAMMVLVIIFMIALVAIGVKYGDEELNQKIIMWSGVAIVFVGIIKLF